MEITNEVLIAEMIDARKSIACANEINDLYQELFRAEDTLEKLIPKIRELNEEIKNLVL